MRYPEEYSYTYKGVQKGISETFVICPVDGAAHVGPPATRISNVLQEADLTKVRSSSEKNVEVFRVSRLGISCRAPRQSCSHTTRLSGSGTR
jgi:hypothetical protein